MKSRLSLILLFSLRRFFFIVIFILFVNVFIVSPVTATHASGVNDENLRERIFIDAGHGGKDSGCVSDYGLRESEINLNVALYLKKILQSRGFQVALSRKGDTYFSLGERVMFAKKFKPDLFVSIHHNSTLGDRSVNRTEFYYKIFDERVSRQCGRSLLQWVSHLFSPNNPALIPGNYYVLRNSPFPALLGEASYLSKKSNALRAASRGYQLREAALYFRGISSYFNQRPPKIHFVTYSDKVSGDPFITGKIVGNFDKRSLRVKFDDKDADIYFDSISTFRAYPANSLPTGSGRHEVTLSCESRSGLKSRICHKSISIRKPAIRVVGFHGLDVFFTDLLFVKLSLLDATGQVIRDGREVEIRGKSRLYFKGRLTEEAIILRVPVTEKQLIVSSYIGRNKSSKGISIQNIKFPLHISSHKSLLFGQLQGCEKGYSQMWVNFFGHEKFKVQKNGQFLIPRSQKNSYLHISPGAGFKPQKWSPEELSYRRKFRLETTGLSIDHEISFALDWESEQTTLFWPQINKFTKLCTWLGMRVCLTQTPEKQRSIYDRIGVANVKPTRFFFGLKHIAGQDFVIFRHYPRSKRGKKMVSRFKKYYQKFFKSALGSRDFFGPYGGYQLTNTTASAIVIHGDFTREPLRSFFPTMIHLLRESAKK